MTRSSILDLRSSILARFSDFMFSKRQIADALARSREDCVADRRQHRRNSRLADPGGGRVAFYQVYARFNRGFVDPRDRIIVEVGLLDRAARGRDFAHQRDAGAEYRRALELRLHAVGVDHSAY